MKISVFAGAAMLALTWAAPAVAQDADQIEPNLSKADLDALVAHIASLRKK